MPDARERLIVALDVPNAPEARRIVAAIGDSAQIYKVGKQLFTAEGPQVVRDLVASGRDVFLDLKYHDIPNTVAGAVRQAAAARRPHADRPRLRRPQDAQGRRGGGWRRGPGSRPGNAGRDPRTDLILAVTVLTSLNDEDLQEIGVSGRVARPGPPARCPGPYRRLRRRRDLRPRGPRAPPRTGLWLRHRHAWHPSRRGRPADQERVVTPSEAIAAGASHIVVGRPITAAPDPAAAARRILDEIASATPVMV